MKIKLLNTILLIRQWVNGEEITIQEKKYIFPHGVKEIRKMIKEFDNVL